MSAVSWFNPAGGVGLVPDAVTVADAGQNVGAFKLSGVGVNPGDPFAGPTPFTFSGYGTHLGRLTGTGSVTFTVVGTKILASGNVTFTADMNASDGSGAGSVSWTGGTGRFADANGVAGFTLQNLPDGTFTATIDGQIHF